MRRFDAPRRQGSRHDRSFVERRGAKRRGLGDGVFDERGVRLDIEHSQPTISPAEASITIAV
jgi:hypothetical protein